MLIQNKLWNNAVGRLYYACYYAVSALLIDRAINAKTHTGTRQMFGKNFVEPGIIGNEHGKVFSKLFGMRHVATMMISLILRSKTVMSLIKPATELISEIECLLLKQ